MGRVRGRSLHLSKVLSKGSKTKFTASIGITLGFVELRLGLGLGLLIVRGVCGVPMMMVNVSSAA